MQFAEDMKTPFLMRIGMELPAIDLLGFMTEQTAEFRRVTIRKRNFSCGTVALSAKFFRFLFVF